MDTEKLEIEPIDEETKFLIDQLYQLTPTTMVLHEGQVEEVPETGNIGLLANGYKGIIAWRKQREKVYGKRIYSPYVDLMKKGKEKKKGNKDE
jgi:hypothetical protein